MFAVVSVESVPEHLRGYLSRFLQEVRTGLYVGVVSRRVVDELWGRTVAACPTGWAVLVRQDSSFENGFDLLVHGQPGTVVVDLDGVLMLAKALKSQKSK